MSAINLTSETIERRLDTIERLIVKANAKDLPTLNRVFDKLLTELVQRDIASAERG